MGRTFGRAEVTPYSYVCAFDFGRRGRIQGHDRGALLTRRYFDVSFRARFDFYVCLTLRSRRYRRGSRSYELWALCCRPERPSVGLAPLHTCRVPILLIQVC